MHGAWKRSDRKSAKGPAAADVRESDDIFVVLYRLPILAGFRAGEITVVKTRPLRKQAEQDTGLDVKIAAVAAKIFSIQPLDNQWL